MKTFWQRSVVICVAPSLYCSVPGSKRTGPGITFSLGPFLCAVCAAISRVLIGALRVFFVILLEDSLVRYRLKESEFIPHIRLLS